MKKFDRSSILAVLAVLLALRFFFLKKENHTPQELIKTQIIKVFNDSNLKQSDTVRANPKMQKPENN